MKLYLIIFLFLKFSSGFSQTILRIDSIPFTINEQNTISVKAVFNETDTLNLNFDTGTTGLILTNSVLKNNLKSPPKLYNTFYNLHLGNSKYRTKVYDAELTGHGTDGRFGWDLFKNKIVELNYDLKLLIIHSSLPNNLITQNKISKLKIEFYKDVFFVESDIKQNKIIHKDLFLFDTGYQRTVMLNSDKLKEIKFPSNKMKFLKKLIMYGAQGNEIPVITSSLQSLKIGRFNLKNVPVQITSANRPFKDRDIHILGNEVLKRFNLYLDFQNNFVYLKPNSLYNDNYIDNKKI